MATLFAHEDNQRAFARLATVSIPLGARVLQYIALFTPPKTRLTAAKKIKLLLQLLPDLERKAIQHKGREWAAPLEAWALAIDQMLASRDTGRLELPMRGHGYLYSVLAGLADRHEASAEAEAEAARRSGHFAGAGNKVVQYAGKDPALAAIEESKRNAAPMPPEVRAQLAALRGRTPPTNRNEQQ